MRNTRTRTCRCSSVRARDGRGSRCAGPGACVRRPRPGLHHLARARCRRGAARLGVEHQGHQARRFRRRGSSAAWRLGSVSPCCFARGSCIGSWISPIRLRSRRRSRQSSTCWPISSSRRDRERSLRAFSAARRRPSARRPRARALAAWRPRPRGQLDPARRPGTTAAGTVRRSGRDSAAGTGIAPEQRTERRGGRDLSRSSRSGSRCNGPAGSSTSVSTAPSTSRPNGSASSQ